MPQAIGDPDELDRFAVFDAVCVSTLNEAINCLDHSFSCPRDTWQDEKRASFEEDYHALVQQLSHFEANASEQIPYLYALASRLRDYLQS